METIHVTYPLDSSRFFPPVALAIGYFDGVHLGHQAVIGKARRLAEELGTATGIMTFHPHPREVLGREEMPHYLTPLPEKLKQFARLGVERTYVMRFDLGLASKTADEFVEDVLLPLQVRGAAVGFNFSFGRGAAGKAQDLVRLGRGRFRVEVAEPIYRRGLPLSSTRLRGALSEGAIRDATEILGRPYTICGTVVHGDHRGREIGFPTANLSLTDPYMVPAHGVYIVRVRREAHVHEGIMNIGVRPTFDDPAPRRMLEVHLFDFRGNLYGETVEVEFLHRLREEKRFATVEDLIHQIHEDEKRAREWLARLPDREAEGFG